MNAAYRTLIAHNFKKNLQARSSFFLDMAIMCINNLGFLLQWKIFFLRFQSIGEWGMEDVATSLVIMMASYGSMLIFFGGVRLIPQYIVHGDIDLFLLQPKNILLKMLFSQSYPRGFGNLLSATLFILLFRLYSYPHFLLIPFFILIGTLLLTSIRLTINSLIFWIPSIEEISEKYIDAFFMMSSYPSNIYSGFIRLLTFTLFPVAFITFLPVEILRTFSLDYCLYYILGTLFFLTLAFTSFYLGLRRYLKK